MAEQLTFEFIPRFYILCFYNESIVSQLPTLVTSSLQKTQLAINEIRVNEIFEFPFKHYTHLGYIEIDFIGDQELTNVKSKYVTESYFSTAASVDSTALFEFSRILEQTIASLNSQYNESLFLDCFNPPYIATIALHTNLGNILWGPTKIQEFRESIGKWTEFYSGQFNDYSDELWQDRISHNLSNRLSELHYIRENSAFIYMPTTEFIRNFAYMEDFFLRTIIQVKGLKFAIYLINIEIDSTNDEIESYGADIPLTVLEAKINYVTKLSKLINQLNARFFKDKIINRRSHGKKVLNHCYKVFDIVDVKEGIDAKLNILNDDLTNARAKRQEELSSQSRKWIIVLNLILGSQVLFTLRDEVIDKFNITNTSTINTINTITTTTVVVAVVVAVAGLSYTWLRHKFGFFKPSHPHTLE